ncbi:uncharacterized protein Dwil_GK15681 [Drosophila willistoni]|uniref:Uncharacterized protein n=1 Tax=Drosophila willistoni TaxID=7260 RepID=B4NP85_DROWI|nr:uncharacterized protein Dwil_GK15681 [Drosophila willistoni]
MSEEELSGSLSSVDISGVAQNLVREYVDGSQYEKGSTVDTEVEENGEENVMQFSSNSSNDHGINLLEALKKHERQIMKLRDNITDANCKMLLFESHANMVRSDIDFITTVTEKVHERIREYEEELMKQGEEQVLSEEQEQELESEQISELDQVSEVDVELDQDLDQEIEPESELITDSDN